MAEGGRRPRHCDDCIKRILQLRWSGARISFKFMACPQCKGPLNHPALEDVAAPLLKLRETVRRKALMRLSHEKRDKDKELTDPTSEWYGRKADYAESIFAYYECFKCKQPYFGGLRACGAAGEEEFDPRTLICGGCVPHAAEQVCAKHGTDYIEFKCRWCCSIAIWYCHGTTHYCDPCHNNWQQVKGGPCPWKAGKPMKGVHECPLKVDHPPAGTEFALGCGACRNEETF